LGREGLGFAVFFFLIVPGEDTAQVFRPPIVKVSPTLTDPKEGGGIELPVPIVFVEDPDIFQVRDGVIGGLVASGTVGFFKDSRAPERIAPKDLAVVPGRRWLERSNERQDVVDILLGGRLIDRHCRMEGGANLGLEGLEFSVPGPRSGVKYAMQVGSLLGEPIPIRVGIEGMSAASAFGMAAVTAVPAPPRAHRVEENPGSEMLPREFWGRAEEELSLYLA
jgi:hypothetical protein